MDQAAHAALTEVGELLRFDMPSDAEIALWARPDLGEMAQLYATVNEDLVHQMGTRRLSRVVHVTRAARVLLDSTHRQVLVGALAAGVQPELSYHELFYEDPGRATAWSFLASCRPSWKYLDWPELVDVLFLLGEGSALLLAAAETLPVQFSVLGDDGVLLQSPTDRPAPEKYVWFIRSRALAEQLFEERQRFVAEHARIVDRASFKAARLWLLNYELHRWVEDVLAGDAALDETEEQQIADWRLQLLGIWRKSDHGQASVREITSMGRGWKPFGLSGEGES